MTEKHNASQFPKIFYAKHMQNGICGYDNETVLVDTDAIKAMLPSGVGMPIYIQHDYNDSQTRLENLEKDAVGFITESFYNELDGWAWFKCLATKDECHQAIGKGWAVSNAYIGTEFGEGGTKNNCPYNREIKNGKFTHLAIVPNPRYEDACIMSPDEFRNYQDLKKRQLEELKNSKTSIGAHTMFKLFKTTKEEVKTVDADTMVELEGGKSVSIGEMVNSLKERKNSKQMVNVDGEEMAVDDLVNAYCKMNSEKKNAEKKNGDMEDDEKKLQAEKKNAEDEKKKKEEDEKANAEKKNAEEAEKKRKDDDDAEEKKNAKFFDELQNANMTMQKEAPMVQISSSMIERGKKRYGKQS